MMWLSFVIQTDLCWILLSFNCTVYYFVFKVKFFSQKVTDMTMATSMLIHSSREPDGFTRLSRCVLLVLLWERHSDLGHIIHFRFRESLNNWEQTGKQRLTSFFPSKGDVLGGIILSK